ncbi:glycosyltransferase family 4 protein [Desulfovibrio ferrophilus]|uniref:Group 1 glycosyl transferase n=1 Tax=Desulfovibrio ferrophilus TaxID=241368 RepID=A0A2Z6AX88_9BACT|nr:glycosyltransferase family 4 protein [Desulfovibrio ferrophilus]BBD07851.1 group 1 glycosyl transferase [Desulfovibrio ferrophilus]
MPRLLFLTQSGETLPSVRFRVLPFVQLAREAGVDADWMRYPKTALARAAFFARLPKTEIIVLQKKLVSRVELALLRSKAGKLFFDFDDALWASHPNQGACGGESDAGELARLLRVCAGVDGVIAGNAFLAAKVREVSQRVDQISTPLDTQKYVPGVAEHSGRPVVGWMGTSCNLFFLPEVFQALEPVGHKFLLSVISDADYSIPKALSGSSERWDSEREVAQLQAMDIGLMPLTDDEYTRGKCGFKLLQYMACGVVPVASDVGFNREIVTHGVDGFLAATPDDFLEYVDRLASDQDLRLEMSARARETVVSKFGLSAAALRLWDILGLSTSS